MGRTAEVRYGVGLHPVRTQSPRYGKWVIRMTERGGISFDPYPFA